LKKKASSKEGGCIKGQKEAPRENNALRRNKKVVGHWGLTEKDLGGNKKTGLEGKKSMYCFLSTGCSVGGGETGGN